MAAIPTILKGDDSGAITINIASGRTYTGATLVVAYQGVTRQYTNLTPGGTVTLAFTHDETSGFALKTAPLLMRLIGQYGAEETVENAEARIRVTDCLAEVNAGGSFTVQPGGTVVDPTKVPITEVGDVAARYTLADLQAKVNQIVRVLAQRSLMAFGLCAMFASSAAAEVSVQTARLDELWNDSRVVTNVTGGGGSGVDTNSVKSIINAEVGGTNTLVHSDAIADMATKAWTRGEGYAKTNAQGKVTALETDPTATAKAQAAIAAAGCVTTNEYGVVTAENLKEFKYVTGIGIATGYEGTLFAGRIGATDDYGFPEASGVDSPRWTWTGGRFVNNDSGVTYYLPWHTYGYGEDPTHDIALRSQITNVTDSTVSEWGYTKNAVVNEASTNSVFATNLLSVARTDSASILTNKLLATFALRKDGSIVDKLNWCTNQLNGIEAALTRILEGN